MSKRGVAVLQFEISREWWDKLNHIQLLTGNDGGRHRLFALASTACSDVIRNGGTFVLVVSDDKITMVQRTDAETFEADPHISGESPK